MKIISDFKDYYDGVSLDGDSSVVNIRKIDMFKKNNSLDIEFYDVKSSIFNHLYNYEINFKDFSFSILSRGRINNHQAILMFCGKVYPVLKVTFSIDEKSKTIDMFPNLPFTEEIKKDYFYDFKSLFEFIEQLKEKYKIRFNLMSNKKRNEEYLNAFLKRSEIFFEQHFIDANKVVDLQDKTKSFSVLFCSSGFIKSDSLSKITEGIKEEVLLFNIPLKDIMFFKVKNPYEVHQEIENFLSGIISQRENVTVDVSDQCKLYSKGFDCYSFKKTSDSRKRKQKTCKGC